MIDVLSFFALRSKLPGRRADTPEAEALIRRALMVARVHLLILVFVTFDMVLKPT